MLFGRRPISFGVPQQFIIENIETSNGMGRLMSFIKDEKKITTTKWGCKFCSESIKHIMTYQAKQNVIAFPMALVIS